MQCETYFLPFIILGQYLQWRRTNRIHFGERRKIHRDLPLSHFVVGCCFAFIVNSPLPKQLLCVLQLALNHWTTRAQNNDDGASVILVGLLKFGYHEYQWRHFWIILKKNKPILGYYATPDNEPHSIIIMVCSNSEWGINFVSTTRSRPVILTALINIRTIKLTALIKYGALNIFLIIWSFRPKCFWIVWW